jgi:hypothetical protein
MACDDRQLSEAQRVAGYQNQRTGVMQAVRPFSGSPTLPNLLDYINRELYPAVKRTRDKVNDVYLQTTDNAPSGNPLTYYFSTETANADPTTGRVRLDAAPQDTATTLRVSQTNGRLVDVAPWLDVMAGSSTTPLGVVTVTDAINPARFLRFDLHTMVDQGAYWDLGVTIIESSHDNPFVDDGPIAIGFMPGVASTGTTVPPGSLSPIGANTVIGNPTASTAPPVEIAIADFSVLGRAGIAGTGNIESIQVPGTGTLTGESVFLRSSSIRGHIQWRNWTLVDMPLMTDSRFVGNVSGATSRPAYTSFGDLSSNSVTFEFTGKTFIREALSGDVVALQNDNVTTIQPNVVSDTKLRDSGALSVIGRAANSTGDPADISAVAASGAVLRESGSTLGFGTIATAGLADDSVTNAKLRNSAALSVIGRSANSTGDPADISTSSGSNAVLRESGGTLGFGTIVPGAIGAANVLNLGTVAVSINDQARASDERIIIGDPSANVSLTGVAAGRDGDLLVFRKVGNSNMIDLPHESASSAAANRWRVSDGVTLRMQRADETAVALYENSRWNLIGPTAPFCNTPSNVSGDHIVHDGLEWVIRNVDGDKGDITVSTLGTVFTIDNDVVSDAKLRNSAALSVIGRSANSTGDPADIAAANDGEVLRRSGTTLGFGTVATAGLTDDSVTDGKLRNSAALSVIGRAANSTGDPADISAVAASGAVLRESGSTLGFGTIATAGIADAAVTLAKMANLADSTIIGRAKGAGTGVPTALTGFQALAMLRITDAVDTTTTGVQTSYPTTANTYLRINTPSTLLDIQGMTAPSPSNSFFIIQIDRLKAGGAGSVVFRHENAGATGLRLNCPGNVDLFPKPGDVIFCVDHNNRWVLSCRTLVDGDKGDITVSSSGDTWTIDNDVVSNAKLRNSAALSVIGRSVNSSGDPADIATTSGSNGVLVESGGTLSFGLVTTNNILDNTIANADLRQSVALSVVGRTFNTTGNVADISAVAASDAVLRESGSTIAFGQITTGGIANDAVTDGKLRNGGALSVIGRSANSTGDVADISASAASDAVLRESGSVLGFGTIATGGIANNAVTDAKLRQSAALSVVGRSANSTGNVADIAAANDGEVLRRSGTALGFGTIATAGITDAAVTLAKMANLAQSTIIGRAESAGTGVPTALNSTQVVAIIDGEPISWLNDHVFTGNSTRVTGMFRLDGILSSSEGSSVDEKVIGAINVWRLNPTISPLLLNGMRAGGDSQLVLVTNTSTTNNIQVTDEGSTVAAARFALGTTSILIEPLRGYVFWYDGTDSRWKGIGNYPT